MDIIMNTTFKVPGFVMSAIINTFLYLSMMHIAQTLLVGKKGWHRFASVSWNG